MVDGWILLLWILGKYCLWSFARDVNISWTMYGHFSKVFILNATVTCTLHSKLLHESPGAFCFCQHNGACYFIIYAAWSIVVFKQILYSQTNYTRKLKVYSYQHPNYENRLFFSNFFLDHQKYVYFCHK